MFSASASASEDGFADTEEVHIAKIPDENKADNAADFMLNIDLKSSIKPVSHWNWSAISNKALAIPTSVLTESGSKGSLMRLSNHHLNCWLHPWGTISSCILFCVFTTPYENEIQYKASIRQAKANNANST